MASKPRPRREAKKPAKPARMTGHHRDASDCRHPAGARIGKHCTACGREVGK